MFLVILGYYEVLNTIKENIQRKRKEELYKKYVMNWKIY